MPRSSRHKGHFIPDTCTRLVHRLPILCHLPLPPFFPRPSSSVAEILLVVIQSKNVMHNKKTTCEECKSAYAKQLESTNALQREHYTQNIPSVFQALQVGWDRCRLMKPIYLTSCCQLQWANLRNLRTVTVLAKWSKSSIVTKVVVYWQRESNSFPTSNWTRDGYVKLLTRCVYRLKSTSKFFQLFRSASMEWSPHRLKSILRRYGLGRNV